MLKDLAKVRDEIRAESEKRYFKHGASNSPGWRALVEKRRLLVSELNDFWLRAMIGDDTIANHVSIADVEILKYLEDVDVYEEDGSTFKIVLVFKRNPFFENRTVEKQAVSSGNSSLLQVSETKMHWRAKQMESPDVQGSGLGSTNICCFFGWIESREDPMRLAAHFKNSFFKRAIDCYLEEGDAENWFLQASHDGDDVSEPVDVDSDEDDFRRLLS